MHMNGAYKPNAIVRSWPGPATGDTHHQTADGRLWVPCENPSATPTTGVSYGTIVGNEIWDKVRR